MNVMDDADGSVRDALDDLAAHPPAVDWNAQVRRGVARRRRMQRLQAVAVLLVVFAAGAALTRAAGDGAHTVVVGTTEDPTGGSTDEPPPGTSMPVMPPAEAPIGPLPAPAGAGAGPATTARARIGSSAMPEGIEPHLDAIRRTERDTGRTLDLNHQYYRWDTNFPNEMQADDKRQGRTPFINWAPRMDGTATAVPWATIAAGGHDVLIATRARALRDFGDRVLLSFSGGPYDQSISGYGSPADFAAAFRHVVGVFRANGATNVAFAWVMDAEDFTANRADAFYPGDDVVDWVGASAFNHVQRTARWQSFASLLGPFLEWARDRDRTVFVPEFATEEDATDPDRKATWLDDARQFLRSQPQIRAAVYFNADGMRSGDGLIQRWHVDSSPAALEAWRRLAHDPIFAP